MKVTVHYSHLLVKLESSDNSMHDFFSCEGRPTQGGKGNLNLTVTLTQLFKKLFNRVCSQI